MRIEAFAEAMERISSHPDFAQAMATSARDSVELHAQSRLSNWILSDRARALFPFVLFYLDSDDRGDARSGLTATRVKELCVHTGLCSAGRAGAMLALLRVGGLLAAETAPGDRRVSRLVITDKLKVLQRARLVRQFAAIAMVYPEVGEAIPLLGNDDFERTLWRGLGETFIRGFRVLHYADLGIFAERSSGMVILFSLMLTGAAGEVPPRRPVPLAIAALSRRFGVSRTHISRLLRDAEAEGFVKRLDDERLQFTPKLCGELRNIFAALFLYMGHCAHAAAASVRGERIAAGSSFAALAGSGPPD